MSLDMMKLRYLNTQGDFVVNDADRAPEMVFPLVNAAGMMSSITSKLAGDCKTGQNTFLLAPASAETLHESRATRNFFLTLEDGALWSVSGVCAQQQAQLYADEREEVSVYGGLLWHELVRESVKLGLKASTLSFVPADGGTVELMRVSVCNTGAAARTVTPTVAIPLYGRSADNVRDHRHVTSLLQRMTVTECGVRLTPTLTFDERGHRPGQNVYTVLARDEQGGAPVKFHGAVEDYVGCGSYDWPQALIQDGAWLKPGDQVDGYEIVAALQFPAQTLEPGESRSWYIAMGIDCDGAQYLDSKRFEEALACTKAHWQRVGAASFQTGEPEKDAWLRWVAIQPELRRICGCSFLPHHDYGRGGRGWRDLWQDSLALILRDPVTARADLISYFAGVRADGTNATIIGSKPGEFLADRNNIVRVWMDHGFWPLLTLNEYIHQSGDLSILLESQPWFWDKRKFRGETLTEELPASTKLMCGGEVVMSTVLEHLMVQNVTAFFDAGAHGNIRLRGADWNDALDMAADKGESVAFTAAYAGNLYTLAELCEKLVQTGVEAVNLDAGFAELLLAERTTYDRPETRNDARRAYEAVCETREHGACSMSLARAADALRAMGEWLMEHLRKNEFISDHADHTWMNSYYDNQGVRVEGEHGDRVRMMLTGQVFALMSGTATEEQTDAIVRAADAYLFDGKRGGYCLNTSFGSDIPPLGRQFGFAYGHKENGAVFCHMAVMFAYALFKRGRAEAGWKVLNALIEQSMDVADSRMYPGIPEYFDPRGRGMYPYLTGAGSWLMLSLISMVWGVRGETGDLLLAPKLMPEQFDQKGEASIRCFFAGREIEVVYHRPEKESWTRLSVAKAVLDGKAYGACIPREDVVKAKNMQISVTLDEQ